MIERLLCVQPLVTREYENTVRLQRFRMPRSQAKNTVVYNAFLNAPAPETLKNTVLAVISAVLGTVRGPADLCGKH